MEPPRSRSVSIPPPAVSSAPPSPTRSPLGHSPTEDHQQQMLQEEFARKLQVSLAGVQSHDSRERGGSIVGEVMFLDPRARSTDFSHSHNLAPPKKTALSAPPTPTSHNLTSPPSPHAHTSPPSPKSPRTPNSLTSPPSPHAYSSPPSPTLTPHNPLAHSLTSPRSAQAPPPRRKLSTMQLEPLAIVPAKPDLSPTAANTPLPPPLTPVEQEAKKEKKDPILRSLFNKFRGSTKLAPLEA